MLPYIHIRTIGTITVKLSYYNQNCNNTPHEDKDLQTQNLSYFELLLENNEKQGKLIFKYKTEEKGRKKQREKERKENEIKYVTGWTPPKGMDNLGDPFIMK